MSSDFPMHVQPLLYRWLYAHRSVSCIMMEDLSHENRLGWQFLNCCWIVFFSLIASKVFIRWRTALLRESPVHSDHICLLSSHNLCNSESQNEVFFLCRGSSCVANLQTPVMTRFTSCLIIRSIALWYSSIPVWSVAALPQFTLLCPSMSGWD